MSKKTKREKIISLLLTGKHPEYDKYAGKHVMVVDNKIFPLKEGKESRTQLKQLKEKYGKVPVLTFVPRPDISYIL